MTKGDLDVLGVGNAIVDVFAHTDEAFLTRHDLPKGVMTLIDADRAVKLYEAMGNGIELSGGSCGHTIAGPARSEARRVGKERVSTCRSRWSPSRSKIHISYPARHSQTYHTYLTLREQVMLLS